MTSRGRSHQSLSRAPPHWRSGRLHFVVAPAGGLSGIRKHLVVKSLTDLRKKVPTNKQIFESMNV